VRVPRSPDEKVRRDGAAWDDAVDRKRRGGQPGIDAILAIEQLASSARDRRAGIRIERGPVRVIDTFGTEEQKRAVIPGVCKGDLSVSVCMTNRRRDPILLPHHEGGGRRRHLPSQWAKVFISEEERRATISSTAGSEMSPDPRGSGQLYSRRARRVHVWQARGADGAAGHAVLRSHLRGREGSQEDVVVKSGQFKNLMTTFDLERCGNAACVWALPGEPSMRPRRTRWSERPSAGRYVIPGHPVQDRQHGHEVGRGSPSRVPGSHRCGPGLPSMYESAMAKCFANEMAAEVTSAAMQVFGGTDTARNSRWSGCTGMHSPEGCGRHRPDAANHDGEPSLRQALRSKSQGVTAHGRECRILGRQMSLQQSHAPSSGRRSVSC